MDFVLSEDLVLLQKSVKKIALNEFAPKAAQVDATGEFPWENKKILEENGLLGVHIPEEYGGAGAGLLAMAIVVEETARVCASTSVMLTTQALATDPLLLAGSENQKEKWLRPMAEGVVLGACAITEPGAGSDVSGMRTVAERKAGGYLLKGNKIFITHGGVAEYITVMAYTDKDKGYNGISMIMVPRGTPGLHIGKNEKKMGMRGSDTRELIFDECFVPEENLIGEPGRGFHTLMKTFNYTRPLVAAQALGIAQGAYDEALKYVRQRVQFGKPLSENQGVQWMLAEMAMKIELARTMIYRVCSTIDNTPDSKDIKPLSSMAKWFSSDTAMEVTTNAVQLLGGYGYTSEFPVERMMRDAKITQIYEGTNQIQRMIIAKEILK